MKLLKIARTPAVTIGTESTVRHAVETMVDCGAGAVVVVENQSAKGIFTASDLLKRVVAKGSTPTSLPTASADDPDSCSGPVTNTIPYGSRMKRRMRLTSLSETPRPVPKLGPFEIDDKSAT